MWGVVAKVFLWAGIILFLLAFVGRFFPKLGLFWYKGTWEKTGKLAFGGNLALSIFLFILGGIFLQNDPNFQKQKAKEEELAKKELENSRIEKIALEKIKSDQDAEKSLILLCGAKVNADNIKTAKDALNALSDFFPEYTKTIIVERLEKAYNLYSKQSQKLNFATYSAGFLEEIGKMGKAGLQKLTQGESVSEEIKSNPLNYMLVVYNTTLIVNQK